MTDQDLRRNFQELRRAEERAAPKFSSMWRQPRDRFSRRPLWPRLAAVLTLLILATVPLFVRHHSRSRQTVALASWKSPTDFLLRTPGDELLNTVPRLGYTAVAEPLKGVAR